MKYLLTLLILLVCISCKHSGYRMSYGEAAALSSMFKQNQSSNQNIAKPTYTNCMDYGYGYTSCTTY
jgi:hypothetical protein